MNNPEQYVVRNYREGDERGITALFREVFGKQMSIEQWTWKYAVPSKGGIHSFVAEDITGQIVGHVGAIPLRGVFQNRPLQIFHMADVMIHPKARGYFGKKSLFEQLMKTIFEDIRRKFPNVFCYGFSGNRPFLLGKRIGVYDKIEQGIDCVQYAKSSFLKLYSIKPLDWNDLRLNSLWTDLFREFSLSLIRDRDYLRWRYATNPFFSYHFLGVYLLGRLKGWIVIRDRGDEVLIVDILIEAARCRGVLKTLGQYLAAHGKKPLCIWLPERWRKNIRDYTFRETEVVVCNMVWKLPFQTQVIKENLFYTMGDADIF